MSISTDEIRSVLKDLSEIAKDGEEGFAQAATKVSRADLKTKFLEFSQQRGLFATELHQAQSELGSYPSDAGTLSGSLHRGWLDIKSKITHNDDAAIISEAERGEDVAKKHYHDAVAKDLPVDIRNLIQRQYDKVLETHNYVRSLEMQTKTAQRTI